jgi:hypothetical protein
MEWPIELLEQDYLRQKMFFRTLQNPRYLLPLYTWGASVLDTFDYGHARETPGQLRSSVCPSLSWQMNCCKVF